MSVTCRLCGREFGQITQTHLRAAHNITTAEYRERFPGAVLRPEEINRKTIKTRQNPPKVKYRALCACGCGQGIPENYGPKDKPLKYLNGHRKKLIRERMEKDEMIECACGCGQLRPRYNRFGGEAKYITGHYWQGKKMPPESEETKERKRQAHLGIERPEHSKLMAGEGNSNWRGGISYEPYGPKFNKKLKKQILKRDNYTCQVCRDKAVLPHHINYNKKDNSPDNLIAVCRSCNAKANFNRGAWMVYFFLFKWVGQAE
ncbi:MAG: hypothetical protein H8E40_06055 [Chloroflexi bacterium]|nr:hypothetical protein [Chloroflexota bacterium]